jgi:hypothetical protein
LVAFTTPNKALELSASAGAVRLNVDRPQSVTVTLYDMLGRKVATLFSGEVSAPTSWTLPSLSSGVYVVRAVGEREVATRSIVVAR